MPNQWILVLIILLLVSWFLIVERQNFFEKIFIMASVTVIYATYRILTGVEPSQIFTPLMNFFFT